MRRRITIVLAIAGMGVLIGAVVVAASLWRLFNTPPIRTGTPEITAQFQGIKTRVKSPTPADDTTGLNPASSGILFARYVEPKPGARVQDQLYTSCTLARRSTPTHTPQPGVTPQVSPTAPVPTPHAQVPTMTAPGDAEPDFIVVRVVGAESEACYQVGEVFLGRRNEYEMAVGVTRAINGEIAIDRANVANSRIGQIVVDISQLRSDASNRDGAIRELGLESNRYPLARLLDARPVGLPVRPYRDGETLDFQVVGALEIRNIKRETAFAARATLSGDTLVVRATADLKMSDFGIAALSIGGDAIRVNDDFRLVLNLVAREPKAAPTQTACLPTGRETSSQPEFAPERTSVGAGHVLRGAVLEADTCAPIARARVVLWLANSQGVYDDAHRATVVTDETGQFTFESNFPGAYENTAPHIHLFVEAQGYRTVETEHLPRRGQTEGQMRIVLRRAPGQ